MRRFTTLFVAMLLLGIGTLSAQKFEISGTVIDTSEQPIPYATVILTQEQQSKQIAQLEEENRWLRDQLAKATHTEDKAKQGLKKFFTKK